MTQPTRPKDTTQSGFNESYSGTPPWDIGRAQKEFIRLDEKGEITGSVLDAGCGTGEHVIYFATRGHEAWGVDFAAAAIEKAKEKAMRREIKAVFRAANALKLSDLNRKFDTIIDCGLFHVFSDKDRQVYSKSLASALKTGGNFFMLCFSENEPAEWGGPRRVTQKEIRDTFSAGWTVNYIRDAVFETNFHPQGGKAWLASITKI